MFRFHVCIALLSALFLGPSTAGAQEIDQFPYTSFPTKVKTVTLKSGKKAILISETSDKNPALIGMRCLSTGDPFDGFKAGETLVTRVNGNDSPETADLTKKIKTQSIVVVVTERIEDQRIVPKSKRHIILLTSRGFSENTKIEAELVYQYGIVKRRQDKLVPLISAVDQIANFDFGFGSLSDDDKKWVMQKVEDYTKVLNKLGNARESFDRIIELRMKLLMAQVESNRTFDSLEEVLDKMETQLQWQNACENKIQQALAQWQRDEKSWNLANLEIQIAELSRDIQDSQVHFENHIRDLEFQIALDDAAEQAWYAQQEANEQSYHDQDAIDFDARGFHYDNQFRHLRHNYSTNPDHRPATGR